MSNDTFSALHLTFLSRPPAVASPIADSQILCAIMDIGFPSNAVSLMVSCLGDASLYFENGGGIIGGGAHALIRSAVGEFLFELENRRNRFAVVEEFPLPAEGKVNFYLRCMNEVFYVGYDESDLVVTTHLFAPVYEKAHGVITQLRLISEQSV